MRYNPYEDFFTPTIDDSSDGTHVQRMIIDQDPDPPRRSPWRRWLLYLVSLIVIPSMILVLMGGAEGIGFFQALTERDDIEVVIDDFMAEMEAENAHDAFLLFSERSRQQRMSFNDLEELLVRRNYVKFDQYRAIDIQELDVRQVMTRRQGLPFGTVAQVEGIVEYNDGYEGRFIATLEKVDGEWQLFDIRISVPLGKSREYDSISA